MLLTLGFNSIHRLLGEGSSPAVASLLELPAYAHDHLQLRGLSVPASLLSGWSARDIDQLRDRADKSDCPCLLLVDEEPLLLASSVSKEADFALHRLEQLLRAGHRLGASSVAFSVEADDTDEAMSNTAVACRTAMEAAERLEINMLIAPRAGLTQQPEQIGNLIKKVGGFRLGSFPDFLAACAADDPVTYMRRITPYGGAVNASFESGTEPMDELMRAVISVGYNGAVSVDAHCDGDLIGALKTVRDRLWTVIENDSAS